MTKGVKLQLGQLRILKFHYKERAEWFRQRGLMMDILVAFLAFSATMIVFATMATVIVEVVHKFTRQRKKDFERMLNNYYLGSVKPLVVGAAEAEAKKFVDTIRRNPAFAGEHREEGRWTRGRFFDTAFERLTTPQFVEQLARSNIGQKVHARVAAGEDGLIERLAAEFERYGDAAHDYFQRRAQVFSLFAALVLAITLNIDSVRLFQAFSADNELAKKVIAQIDPDEWEAKYMVAKQIAGNDAEELEQTIKKARSDLQADAAVIGKLDLPIGHAFFPFCTDSGRLKGDSSKHIDPRCNFKDDKGMTTNAPRFEYLKWIINILLSGLLIGLGAPFWFKTYRFLADYVPGINRGPTTGTRVALTDRKTTQTTAATERSLIDSNALTSGDLKLLLEGLKHVSAVGHKTVHQSHLSKMFHSAHISSAKSGEEKTADEQHNESSETISDEK